MTGLIGVNTSAEVQVLGRNIAICLVHDRRTRQPIIVHLGGCVQCVPGTIPDNIISGIQISENFRTSRGTIGGEFHTPNIRQCYAAFAGGFEIHLQLHNQGFALAGQPCSKDSKIFRDSRTAHMYWGLMKLISRPSPPKPTGPICSHANFFSVTRMMRLTPSFLLPLTYRK